MKKKYGFTLVELLVVIVIVGILLLIAIPGINKYLKRGTKDYYISLEKTVMLAGRDYLNDYRALLPREINNVTVIDLDELTSNKYIDEVVDSNGKNCRAKVTAKKVGKNEYEYYSCLMCDDYDHEGNDEECQFDENNNITAETKNYRVVVDTGEYEIDANDIYIVDQGEDFDLPYAKAYYTQNGSESKVSDQVVGNPKTINTNKLGTTTVTYIYKGAKAEIKVKVIDRVKPSVPLVVLRYNNENGKVYKEGTWSNSNIYAEFKSTDYTKPGVMGGGISRYEISEDKVTYNYLNGNSKLSTYEGIYTYYVRSVDKESNISNSNEYTIMIDKTLPSCSINATGTKTSESNVWYTGSVTLAINSTDSLSGVAIDSMVVKDKNGNKVQLVNNTITEDGIYTVVGSVTDKAGNSSTCSRTVKIDKTKPTCSFAGESTTWTKENRTIIATCSDSTSKCTNSTASKSWTYISGTHKTESLSYIIEDDAGNTNTCSKNVNIYVDKEGPTTPTSGAIGNVSGSNTTGSIQTKASGSIDNGVGEITYKYIIKNVSESPSNNDSNFSTTTTFARSCGKSYLAWAIAEDKLGNRSGVYYLGNTSDSANSYSSWSTCSKTCGGGTQTRTNTCALVTTGLSQSCNTKSCNYAATKKTCWKKYNTYPDAARCYNGLLVHYTCGDKGQEGCWSQGDPNDSSDGYCDGCVHYTENGATYSCPNGGTLNNSTKMCEF